ncbi:MAG: hypothetical protein BroJett014_19290 [Planctomycetota bacterium]|nr:hypothetical protein [Planctomycetota bacterium]GIK52956.1 MAG: hypothetical protein BroJett014_19290 [Planctomycetota bacterium]
MYTPAALLDMHARSQRSLRGLIAHCGQLSAEQLAREMPDFGDPTLLAQFAHVMGAQRYWLGCLQGRIEAEDPALAGMAEAEAFRESISAQVSAYLAGAGEAELNTPRAVKTFHGERTLAPAHVVLRTITHIYDHKGKIAAMCRALGKPIPPGLDFPLMQGME